ncbi:MAG TPA: C25 family cysteine peptidase [Bacteroidota bacterium]|nr:C25 family cysteine peptidase [Bacteroidota bacterium]
MTRRLSILLLLVFFAEAALLGQTRAVTRHSWGAAAALGSTSGFETIELTFDPPARTTDETPYSRRVMYYALDPGSTISCRIVGSVPARRGWKTLTRVLPAASSRDSGSMREMTVPVPLTELASAPTVHVTGYGWFRGYYLARIEVTPFFRNSSADGAQFSRTVDLQISSPQPRPNETIAHKGGGDPQFEKILKELILNYGSVQPYAMPSLNDTTGGWFNTSSTYVKLAIPDDGIYRITKDQLQKFLPSGTTIDPRTFQLFDRGKEVPIVVSGEADGSFDNGDYLEFPALRNYTGKQRIITTNLADEYNEYLNRYTDTTLLWLTWGQKDGLRMKTNPSLAPTTDTLTTYTAFLHLESQGPYPGLQLANTDVYSQQDYRWNPFDMWPWNFLNGGASASASFSVSDFSLAGDSVTLYAKFASWGASVNVGAHNIALRLNSSGDLSSVVLNRGAEVVLTGRAPATALTPGGNSVTLFSYPTASNPNTIIYDWFEVEYPRRLNVVNDTLLFDFRSVSGKKLRTVQVTGLQTADVLLYRVKPSGERVTNFSLSSTAPFTLTFSDTVDAGTQYCIIPQSRAYTPLVKKVKTFAGLRATTSQTDYIAITNSKFYPEAQQYVQTVGSLKHLATRLVNVDDIDDEFGYGYPTPDAVHLYVRSAFRWQPPMPSFLVLLGDASYDYKYYEGDSTAVNYVPSVGYPVSDVAYALADTITGLPQMNVGRIPVKNVGELSQYRSVYSSYVSSPYDDWNKRFLFFSGGDPTVPGEIDLLKSVQDQIIATVASPAPVGGITTQFYKTINPQSDFGPLSPQAVADAISSGGVFISYIGHSGTQTWDNSIGDPLQLKNSRGRYSLITDFGCSTGKFAEPLITSFSEEFIVGSSASSVDYIGNSSLGFESIATSLPPRFYSAMLQDTILRVGETHLIAKLRQIAAEGLTTVNSIMLYNNTLIGDPTVDLAVPFLPNLVIQPGFITPVSQNVSDDQDSAAIRVVYANYGSVTRDTVEITIQQRYESTVVRSWTVRRPMPLVYDTLTVYASVRQLAGDHTLTVNIDPLNAIAELSKGDNSATKSFQVVTSEFKAVTPSPFSTGAASSLVLLNPTTQRYDPSQIITLDLDSLPDFSTPVELSSPMGIVTTSFSLGTLRKPARYYWRARFQSSTGNWTTGSFYLGAGSVGTLGEADSVDWQKNSLAHVAYAPGIGASIQSTLTSIQVISSGFLDGKFGVIDIGGANVLPSSFGRGHQVVVIDPAADTLVNLGTFDVYGNPAEADSLAAFLTAVPQGYYVAAGIIDEGSYHLTPAVYSAYHSIGSMYIDSVGYRDSWAIFGKKGLSPGSALESYKKSSTGKAVVETTLVHPEAFGTIVTPAIGPVSGWNQLSLSKNVPAGTHVAISMVGLLPSGSADTLFRSYDSSSVALQSIAATRYPTAQFIFSLQANSSLISPVLRSWSVRATPPPELVVSQNTLQLQKSSFQEGEIVNVGVTVFNVGLSPAESVVVAILTDDTGNLRTLKSAIIPLIKAGDSAGVSVQYDSRGRRGSHSFVVQVDPNDQIPELYKFNNTVSAPYTIFSDTVRPSLVLTIDDAQVVDGDFIRAHPSVTLQLRDPNGIPVSPSDTSIIYLEVDNNQVYFTGNSSIQFVPGTPPLIAQVLWSPELSEGTHTLRFYGKDAAGNSSDTTVINIQVANQLQLTNVFNIPNPFGNGTTFTFTLSGSDDPQSAHIKIYTVTGRLIQDLDISSRVHVGANGYKSSTDNLYWDGRDRDGSEIANGVYFYRVIIREGGQETTATQKLVKMR